MNNYSATVRVNNSDGEITALKIISISSPNFSMVCDCVKEMYLGMFYEILNFTKVAK